MTIIIGKSSNLSKHLFSKIENSYLFSSYNALQELKVISFDKDKKINIIFNNFQKSTLLNDISYPDKYIQMSIMTTAEVLDYFAENNISINKILYTSSSSVYGNNVFCKEGDHLIPTNLHSSLKIANEKLIERFCNKFDIEYTICRIFNMYGGDDEFSVISKIINSVKSNSELIIFNNGNAIRDFIHIEDVVKIYQKLLIIKSIPILNIGTSCGISIKSIIEYLQKCDIPVNYQTKFRDELKASIADITLLDSLKLDIKYTDSYRFISKEIGK